MIRRTQIKSTHKEKSPIKIQINTVITRIITGQTNVEGVETEGIVKEGYMKINHILKMRRTIRRSLFINKTVKGNTTIEMMRTMIKSSISRKVSKVINQIGELLNKSKAITKIQSKNKKKNLKRFLTYNNNFNNMKRKYLKN